MRFFWSDGMAPKRGEGFLGGSYPYYAVYDTKDGKHLTIGCTEPWLWENFCKAINRPDLVKFARKSDQFVRAAERGRGRPRGRRSRPSSRPAPATSGTTSWSRPTSAWARSTSRRRCVADPQVQAAT